MRPPKDNVKIFAEKLKSLANRFSVYYFLVGFAVALGIFFRTYNYANRVHLDADNSRDAQIAIFAYDHGKVPIIGQFSSAAPFFYGPWWYWFLETLYAHPLGYLTVWYFMSLLSVLFLVCIFFLGSKIGGRYVGLFSLMFASVSPGLINNSLSVWNPSIMPFFALIIIFLLLKFIENGRIYYLFLLGFFSGLSITVHFQGILLTPSFLFGVVYVFFSKKFKNIAVSIIVGIVGFVLPFSPLVYFDYYHFWFDTRNLLIYLLVDQYKIWVPNRWLTYVFSYWPKAWSEIVSGNSIVSYAIIILLLLFLFREARNLSLKRPIFVILLVFIFEIVIYRYYRGERFNYYSLFAYPLVIVLSSWACFELYKKNALTGMAFVTLVVLVSVKTSLGLLGPSQINFNNINLLKNDIYSKNYTHSFNIFSCPLNGNRISHPLSLFIYMDGRESLDGKNIMVCERGGEFNWEPIREGTSTNLLESVATSNVFEKNVEWWKTNPPQIDHGDLLNFIRQNSGNGFVRFFLNLAS